ncbi:hypothetical protein MUN82_14560 [Hymenobacter aerilatus]|uniref:Uncharacterized protein n=1 Tax=Hymenobacter aerilatus TaxID=2932251 RepID=A0A8T9STW7_9BACT|nr:hypothetical protein [Hymenobacter aerilatus]UOR04163.1 hypothetical protein MUN82_14560 [Hymenobacter aerilatus]
MLLFGGELYAQSTSVPVAPPATFSHSDTIRAVQRVFSKHQTGGWIWAAAGAILAGRVASVATNNNSAAFSSSTGGTIIGAAILGGIPVSIGVGKLTRFSYAKEEQVVALYEKSGILPPYVKKRLKSKHFK